MKRIIISILLFSSLVTKGQIYQKISTWEEYLNRLRVTGMFRPPLTPITGADKGSFYYQESDSTYFYWSGNAYRKIVGAIQLTDSSFKVGSDTITIQGTGGGADNSIATGSRTATGDYIQDWMHHWFFLNNIKALDLNSYRADANHPANKKLFRFYSDSTIDANPLQLKWGLKNVNEDFTDSLHFELTSTKDLTYLYHYGNGGGKSIEMDWDAGAFYPNTKIYANGNSRSGYYEFGASTAEIHPQDSTLIKAVPAAYADSTLGIRALSNGVNTIVKFPTPSGGGDTTNKWVNDIKRSNDSVFAFKNGSWQFKYKDSVGGGSGISGLTAGRVVIPASSTTVTDDAGLTYSATNNTLNTDSVNNLKSTIGGSKQVTGVIQQDFFRDRTSLGYQYSTALPNGTVTLDGNKMIISGGVGNSSNHITREYWRGSESWSDTITARVGTINGSSYGIIYSQIGTNFSNHAIFYMDNGSGDFGHILLETSLGSAIATSAGAITLATGDSIVMIVSRSHDVWSATWNDITSSTSCNVSYTFSYSSGTNTFHNAYRNRLYLYGGTQNIGSWKMGSRVLKNIPVIGVGNSIMAGHFAGSLAGRYMNQVFSNDYTLFDISAGPSDRIADVINKLPSILACNPMYVFIDIGTNDAGAGMTISQFQAAYTDMISRFMNAGVRVVVGAITPRNSMDVTPYNSVIAKIASLYGLTYVDLYTPLKSGGSGLSGTYDAGDGLHINSAGNTLMATTITSAAPELLTAGKSYTVQVNNTPSFFNSPTIFNKASFNQSAEYNIDLPLEDSTRQLATTGWFKRAINSSSSVGFVKTQFTSAQSGSAWLDGTLKALKFALTPAVNIDAAGGQANGYEATAAFRATANNDVLSAVLINPTFNDNSKSGVSHYALQIMAGDIGLIDKGIYFNLSGGSSRILTVNDHIFQSNSSGSGSQFIFNNAITSSGFSGNVFTIKGAGTASSGIMFKVLGVSDAELFNVNAAGRTLVGTATDNAIGKLQVNGKATIATVDSTATAPNMLYQDPATGEMKKTAAPAIVLKGTTNWTPGVVAAGSSATTTISVTGATVGDPVSVSKKSGISNGEIYDALVTAPNVVTLRVHNVSTGSANYSSAADYNVVVFKY